MAMARRQLVWWCLLVVACGGVVDVASAAGKKAPKLPPNGKPPPSKLRPVSNNLLHKRDFEVSCKDDYGNLCNISCPSKCPNKCLAYCEYCLTFCMCDIFPGTSCGDPRFTGGDGNTFYFHGKKGQDFCILSDADLHINAHFIGNRNPAMKRDFTWVQALGVSFGEHRLYVGARRAVEWDEEDDHIQIAFDGEPVDVDAGRGARWAARSLPGLSVTRTDTVNTVTVELAGVFSISANAVPITDEDSRVHNYGKTGEDSLVHLDLGFSFPSLSDAVDGVLGQTYRPNYVSNVNIKASMPIMGGAPKYLSSGLFATDCAASRFHRSAAAAAVVTYAS